MFFFSFTTSFLDNYRAIPMTGSSFCGAWLINGHGAQQKALKLYYKPAGSKLLVAYIELELIALLHDYNPKVLQNLSVKSKKR